MADDCSSIECPVPGGYLRYDPSKEGNAVILAAFAVLIPVTLGLSYRFKTPTFAVLLSTGLLLEVLGFSARILLHGNVAHRTYFALSLLGTVLGPTFIAAAVFSILPHAISIYGAHACRVKPKHVVIPAAVLVVAILLLEVLGAVLIPFRVGSLQLSHGAFMLVAGLSIQAVALLMFIGVHVWMTIWLTEPRVRLDLKYAVIYDSSRFNRFLLALQIGCLLLLGHTIYRAIELISGIPGPIFQNQIAFMIANGAVPLAVCILFSAFPPGAAFGPAWGPTSLRRGARRSARPPPLGSPVSPYYEERQSPRRFEGDPKQHTPTTANSLPLQHSTMATTVYQNPVTQMASQPSPVTSAPKNSPTYWREQRRFSTRARADSNPQSIFHQSPKTSPTFQAGAQSEQSPTFQQQQQSSVWTGSRRNSRMAQTPGHLVQDDTLW